MADFFLQTMGIAIFARDLFKEHFERILTKLVPNVVEHNHFFRNPYIVKFPSLMIFLITNPLNRNIFIFTHIYFFFKSRLKKIVVKYLIRRGVLSLLRNKTYTYFFQTFSNNGDCHIRKGTF